MSEEPSSYRTCPKCGTALAADSVEGLCPACLLALNLATQTQLPEEFGPNGTRKVPPTPKSPPTPEDIGSQFPQFEILECLGRGGMGVVYKARQKSLDRLVALKILAPEREKDPQFAERFAREARTLAQLSHPSIVTVHDFGEANGMFYLVMEFVDGVNLRQLLRERKLSPEEALAVVPPICEALQYAHQQGVIHRDIKPENLLLDKQGRIKIADFGIAKILGRTADKTGQRQSAALHGVEGTASSVPTHSQQTSEGPALTRNQTIGTPQYMAPEQTAFPQRVDHRADIYSLGVVLYEMLTGELPGAKLQPPSKKVQVDVRIDEIVLRALEKQPEQRYQTAEQFKTVVETMAAGFKDSGTGSPRSEPNVRASLADRREEPRSAAVSTTRVPGRLTGLARGCFFMAGTVFLVGIGLLLLLAIGGIIVSLALPAYHRAKSQATARYSDASDSASNAQPADSFAAAIPTDHPVTWVESGKPAEVQLGRGISVEIVGVLRDPRNSNGWIKPDGSVFGSAPAAVVQLAEPRPIDSPAPTIIPENEVLVYYRIGTPEGVTIRKRGLRWQPQPWTLDYGRGAFPTVRDTSGDLRYTVGHFALREAVPALDLTVELVASDARWEPMAEFDGKSTKELVPNCMVVFSPPRFDESAKRHVIDVMHNIPRKDHTLRLVAYSKGGQRTEIDFHPGATSGTPTKGFALVYPDEVKVDEVEKWVLERTPWLRGEIRNIAVQPRPASAGTATFGPVMERMINDPDYMQGSEALDLDTGLSLSHPANLESVDDLMTWLAQNEADLLAGRRDGWMIGTAETNELKLVLLPEDSWATETAAGLDARLAAAPRNVLIKEPRRDEPVKVYTLPDSQPFPHTFGFQTHQGSTGILQFTGFTDDARGVKLRYKLVEGVRGLHQASASSKRQRFVPEPGMANQTSWMVFDKPSFLNTNGWAVMSRLTIGGVAKIKFPEEAERRCDIELLRGDDTSITVRILDLARNGVMTLSLVRDQPGEITVDGAGYRVTYLSVYIARDKPDTSAFAQVVVTPVNETASRSEPANSPDLARTRSSVTDTTRVQLMESDPHRRTWRWRVFREPGARMVYGILDVTDPDNPQQLLLGMENEPLSLTSSQDYTLRLNLDQDGWRMEIESAWVGENGGRGANWDRLEIPPGATLHATLPEQLSELNTSRYHVFWMGTLELDGRVLKRLRFVARLAEAADPVQNMFDDTDGVRTFDVAPDFEARAHRMGTNFVRMRPGLMPLGARMALLLLPVLLIMAVPLGGAVWWITAGIKHGSALQRSALLLAAGGPLLAAVVAFVLDNLGIIGHLVFITALLACEIPAFCFGLMSRQTGLGKAAMIVSATIVIISLFLLL